MEECDGEFQETDLNIRFFSTSHVHYIIGIQHRSLNVYMEAEHESIMDSLVMHKHNQCKSAFDESTK